MMKYFLIKFVTFATILLLASSKEIQKLKISNRDFTFTASWEPLLPTNSTTVETIKYTLYAVGLAEGPFVFTPVTNCINVTEHSCSIDPELYYFPLAAPYEFKVNATLGNEFFGGSKKLDYIPINDDILITAPNMNVTRDGGNITVYLTTPRYMWHGYDYSYFEIQAFTDDTNKKEYIYKTETPPGGEDNVIVSWLTSVPDNITICVRARYLFETYNKIRGQWAQKCVELDNDEPALFTERAASANKYQFPIWESLSVIFGVIFLVILIVGIRIYYVKHFRNPFQDPDLTLPRETVIATNFDDDDAFVVVETPIEKYENIRSHEDYKFLDNVENDTEILNTNFESFNPEVQNSELISRQEMPTLELTPIENSEKFDLLTTGRNRVESADSAFCDGVSGLLLPGGIRRPKETQFVTNSDKCTPLHESPTSQGSCESVFSEDEGYVRVPDNNVILRCDIDRWVGQD